MLLAEQSGGIWPLVGVMAAMLLLLMTFWRMSRRTALRGEPLFPKRASGDPLLSAGSKGGEPPAGRGVTGGWPATDLPSSLNAWEVHLHETAREASALVDTKVRLLRRLAAEADRAAARLERALAAAQTYFRAMPVAASESPSGFSQPQLAASGQPEPAGSAPIESASDAQPKPAGSAQPELFASADKRNSLPKDWGLEPACGERAAESAAAGPTQVRPEALALEVGLLADYGFPLEEIASRCGISLAQVEAILQQRSLQASGGLGK